VRLLRFLAVAAALVGGGVTAYTCECISVFVRGLQGLKHARFVYVGRVRLPDPKDPFTYEVRPTRVYKGARSTYHLYSIGGGASCGAPLHEGEWILMYADADPQQLSECGRYALSVCSAREDITALDRNARFPPLVIPGLSCDSARAAR
jgi:hypothetical protein